MCIHDCEWGWGLTCAGGEGAVPVMMDSLDLIPYLWDVRQSHSSHHLLRHIQGTWTHPQGKEGEKQRKEGREIQFKEREFCF